MLLTQKQKILIGVLLLLFAAVKIAALMWWKNRQPEAAAWNAAACNVAEMTERHRDRLCDFRDKVHRRHDHDGLGKALEPAAHAVALDGTAPA